MLRPFDVAQVRPFDLAQGRQTRHERKICDHFKLLAVCQILEG